MNDEIRMTNDEGMTKPEARDNGATGIAFFPFVLRHSSFVIKKS
jgi:hypothetical protein